MAATSFSPAPAAYFLSLKRQPKSKPYFHPVTRTPHLSLSLSLSLHPPRSAAGEGPTDGEGPTTAVEASAVEKEPAPAPAAAAAASNGAAATAAAGGKKEAAEAAVPRFKDPRWANGTWDLKQFERGGGGGGVDWDAVIDAEARRRKWLEDYPEATSTDEAVVFDTSIIPWWAWIKRFHLPEAERLNGRAAMIGFFMAYFVDSLTGVGLVDQMGNFFCKTLLFVAVVGVLLIRKNEDIKSLKKLLDETTFYDKQWQATWQEDSPTNSKK